MHHYPHRGDGRLVIVELSMVCTALNTRFGRSEDGVQAVTSVCASTM